MYSISVEANMDMIKSQQLNFKSHKMNPIKCIFYCNAIDNNNKHVHRQEIRRKYAIYYVQRDGLIYSNCFNLIFFVCFRCDLKIQSLRSCFNSVCLQYCLLLLYQILSKKILYVYCATCLVMYTISKETNEFCFTVRVWINQSWIASSDLNAFIFIF